MNPEPNIHMHKLVMGNEAVALGAIPDFRTIYEKSSFSGLWAIPINVLAAGLLILSPGSR